MSSPEVVKVTENDVPVVIINRTPAPVVRITPVGTPGVPGRGILSFERISGDGSPGSNDVYRVSYTDGTHQDITIHQGEDSDGMGTGLSDHIVDTTPHPAYDDMVSLSLLFENGLV